MIVRFPETIRTASILVIGATDGLAMAGKQQAAAILPSGKFHRIGGAPEKHLFGSSTSSV